jgi:hypothetical protein
VPLLVADDLGQPPGLVPERRDLLRQLAIARFGLGKAVILGVAKFLVPGRDRVEPFKVGFAVSTRSGEMDRSEMPRDFAADKRR